MMRSPLAPLLAGSVLLLALTGCTLDPRPVPAAASPCPAWANDPPDLTSNAEKPALGCPNIWNLTRMIDQPQDLQAGRRLGPADGRRQAHAVDLYQSGKVPEFKANKPSPSILLQPPPAAP
jgi:hypothetical protein